MKCLDSDCTVLSLTLWFLGHYSSLLLHTDLWGLNAKRVGLVDIKPGIFPEQNGNVFDWEMAD